MKNLESITIHQFRGLRGLKLEGLGGVNLLVGANNSGKTSVLEALAIYSRPRDFRFWLNVARQREQENRRSATLENLQWLFTVAPTKRERITGGKIGIESQGDYTLTKLEAEYKEIEETRISGIKRHKNFFDDDLPIDDDESLMEISEIETRRGLQFKINLTFDSQQLTLDSLNTSPETLEIWEDDLSVKLSNPSFPNLSISLVTLSSHRTESIITLFSDARRGQDFKSDIIDLLQLLDKDIQGLEILPKKYNSKFDIYIDHARLGLAPISVFGDGLSRLFHIGLKVLNIKKGGLILIDELGTALHTKALENAFTWLVTWCEKNQIQIFATTHSLEVVDTLINATEHSKNLTFYRLSQKEMQTRVVRHERERLQRLREELGQEVRL